MAIRYRRYRANNFRFTRQASVRELELTAAIVLVALLTYFATRVSMATLWIIFICVVILGIAIGIIGFTVFQRSLRRSTRALQILGVIDIDQMQRQQLESYLTTLLQGRGYQSLQVLQHDQTSTLFITKKGRKLVGVYLFRQAQAVSNALLLEALLAKNDYSLNNIVVVTTGSFTPAARRTAFSRRVTLIDRRQLAHWVLDFQEKQY